MKRVNLEEDVVDIIDIENQKDKVLDNEKSSTSTEEDVEENDNFITPSRNIDDIDVERVVSTASSVRTSFESSSAYTVFDLH